MSKVAGNPYPGARAFTSADDVSFFGRDTDTEVVVDYWLANRLTVVSGPVASGKTSLLRAGVYPAMPVKRSRILPVGDLLHGMTFPFAALPDHNPFTLALLRSWSPEDVPTRLAGMRVSDFVRRLARGEDGAIYAAVDQVEILFLDPRHASQAKVQFQFLAELAEAVTDHPRLHLLLVTRSDALGRLTHAVGGGARHEISALTPQGAVEALTKPAMAAGRFFAEEAARNLIDDLRAPGPVGDGRRSAADRIEPSLLQAVGWRLWESLPGSVNEISDWTIREYCDADTALAIRCGQTIGEVAALYGIASKELRSWLLHNFVTDRGTRGGIHEGTRTTAGLPNAVPRSLLERHLLNSHIDESVCYYRLLSGRLIEPLHRTITERLTEPSAADYLRAAERHLGLGDLDFARPYADYALRAAPGLRERAQAESLLGNVEYRSGKPTEALPHYRRAAEFQQATGEAAAYQLAAVGRLLLAEGELADALTELRAAAERAPNDLGLQTQVALTLWHLGDGRGAVAILNWVLTMDGGHVEARRARGEILADLGEAGSAITDLDRVDPVRPSLRAARGLALAQLGDHAAAAAEFSGAMADAARSGPVLLYAARALKLAGDMAGARERAIEAMDAADPPLSPVHMRLARELARHGIANPTRKSRRRS